MKLLPLTLLAICKVSSATSAACLITIYAESQMLNISTSGWATKEEPLIACTVVNPQVNADHGFAFFTETETDDAYMEIKYIDKQFPQRLADNWVENLSADQKFYLPRLLRNPKRSSDAALIIHSDPSFYPAGSGNASYRFGVCAYGYPKSGRAWTSVSISSVTKNTCYSMPPTQFFER